MDTPRRASTGRLIVGLVLILIGAAWLLANLGVLEPFDLGRYWYVLPLVWGGLRLALGPDADARRGGLWVVLAGVYGWVSVERIGGLGYATAWPIFAIAGGLLMALDALLGRRFGCATRKEADDAR